MRTSENAPSATCSPYPPLEAYFPGTITQYSVEAELRPRERLLAEGPEALSSAELLGILFGFGSKEKTAVELASELISANGDLFGLYNVSMQVTNHKTV